MILAALACASLLVPTASPWQDSAERKPAARDRQEPEQGDLVITATREPRRLFDLPRGAESMGRAELREERLVRTLPEALKESPGVSVQKTGHAQGSPKFRGLTGFHTLLLVDGIRINNSVWRSGNVEYWNTVDAFSVERLELVRGPSSVLYGTDAVTGMGQVFTLGPGDPRTFAPGLRHSHGALFRYSSAEESFIERAETRGSLDRFGWHLGASYKDFGQLTAGRSLGRLSYTGYHELDGDLKLAWALDPDWALSLGYQRVESEDGPRTHSTVFAKPWRGTKAGTGFLRDIDQNRDLLWLGLDRRGESDELELKLSYQLFREQEDRIRSNRRLRVQGDEVDQFGLGVRYRSQLGPATALTAGVEGYHEDVDSFRREFNTDGSLREVRTRGPVADEAAYDQLGVYAQLEHELIPELEALAGVRYQYVEADADEVAIPSSAFAPVHRAWNSVVGSASLLWKPGTELRVFTSVAQSFRAPNLSDLTRLDIALSGDLEIPATDLDPERFVTVELGGRFDDGLRRLGITGFYTDVRDLIQRRPTGNIVGGDTEVTKGNVSDGFFAGFEAEAASRLDFAGLDEWELYGFADLVQAVIDAADPADGLRTHPKGLPPAKGQLGLRWDPLLEERFTFEVFVPWADGIPSSDYNAAERRNKERIPPDGLPGYALLGVRASAKLGGGLRASLAVENITGRDYRIFDSGLNEPGTNVIFTLRAEFR
ncbi:MAG: TonB-dependent receptor [Planctomycetota bacterium]